MSFPGITFKPNGSVIQNVITGPSTERLLIIGTAVDGPLNTPVRVTDMASASRIFGPAAYSKGYKDPNTSTESGKPNGATIPLAVSQALAGGAIDIWCVRASGSIARAATAFTSYMDIEAQNPGRIYNEVTMTCAVASGITTITLAQPTIKGGTQTYTFGSTTLISEVIDSINGDPANQTVYIHPETYPALMSNLASTIPSGTVTLSGGTNGCQAKGEDYATALDGYATALTATDTGTFESILNKRFPFDVCVLTGLHIDDQIVTSGVNGASGTDEYVTSIALNYVLWLDTVYREVQPCHGVLGTRPTGLRSDADIISYVNNNLLATTFAKYNASARWIKAGPFMNEGWKRNDPVQGVVDLGARMSVVAGPDVIFSHPDVGNYSSNFHVVYASMLTTIPPEQSATFKTIPGIKMVSGQFPSKYAKKLVQGLGYDPTNDISGKGAYVCLVRDPRSYEGPMVVFDDCTAADRNQTIRQHQVAHLLQCIFKDMSNALSGFIGKAGGQAAQAAMEARCENVLDGHVKSGGLIGPKGIGYNVEIIQEGTDRATNTMRVRGNLWPAGATRQIVLDLTVKS